MSQQSHWILSRAEMVDVENVTFDDSSITAEMLMNQVGKQIAQWIVKQLPLQNSTVLICAGKGNNAGDALVAALELSKAKTKSILLWLPGIEKPGEERSSLGPLAYKKLRACGKKVKRVNDDVLKQWVLKGSAGAPLVILDGLLGLGAKGALRAPIRSAAQMINQLRLRCEARVISVDLPTGVDTETGKVDPSAVVADDTLTIGFPKDCLFSDDATNVVGRLTVLPLAAFDSKAARKIVEQDPLRARYIGVEDVAHLLRPRAFDSHKGEFGRVGILAGSVGTTGAAVLCSTAAARAGAGLITLLVSPEVYPTLATACIPEVMVHPIKNIADVLKMNFDVLAIGPGLGKEEKNSAARKALIKIFNSWEKPIVIDADGLNLLSTIKGLKPLVDPPGPRLLTPHPGEMLRLLKTAFPKKNVSQWSRKEIVLEFVSQFRHNVTLLLKGARTLVGEYNAPLVYNSTGNPGMATGGMGDTLTGICAALIGQKLSPYEAAYFGAWLLGRTSDLLIECGEQSQESLLPTDVSANLGQGFFYS